MPDRPIDILLIEDSDDDVELLLHTLRKEKLGEKIQVVRDGEEALNLMFSDRAHEEYCSPAVPKLILLDLKLPKVNGMEVLRCLKACAQTRSIPVVILSSSREECDLAQAYSLGANSYIQKPMNFEEYRTKMRDVCVYWLRINEVAASFSAREGATG